MALNTDALATVDQARAMIRDQAADNDLLELLVNGYSRACALYTRREFAPATDDVSRTFRYSGGGWLDVTPYELRAVATVVVGSDLATVDQVTLDEQSGTQQAGYRLEPRQGTLDGTFLRLSLPTMHALEPHHHQVTVTGDWGMTTVPPDVTLACLIAVANGYRNPEAFASRQLGELALVEAGGGGDIAGQSLPDAARNLLKPYRRPRI